MDDNKFQQADKIKTEIAKFKGHLDKIDILLANNKEDLLTVVLCPASNNICLMKEFVDIKGIVDNYIKAVKAKVSQLETDFFNL